MSNLALFSKAMFTATAVVTAATTDTSAALVANLALLYTAPTSNVGGTDIGALVSRLTAKPRDTIAAAQIQLYTSPDGSAGSFRLVDDAVITAYTVGTGIAAPKADFGYTSDAPLRLIPGERLYVGSAVALTKGIVFRAEGGAV